MFHFSTNWVVRKPVVFWSFMGDRNGTLGYRLIQMLSLCDTLKNREVSNNFRTYPVFFIPQPRSTLFCTKSVHIIGSLIWNSLLYFINSNRSAMKLKTNLWLFGNTGCGCLICSWWYFVNSIAIFLLRSPSLTAFPKSYIYSGYGPVSGHL